MYNLGDFAGKLICDIRWIFNPISTKYLFVCRIFFFYTIPIMTKDVIKSDYLLFNNIFPFVNQFLFAFTNGLVVSNNIDINRCIIYFSLLKCTDTV
jgi:hypothetical protein